MIEIKDKSECCGCGACYSVCPKQCIKMKPDEEGFLYPEVNRDICINCGLCEKVCPVLSGSNTHTVKTTYAVRHSSQEIVSSSTSGGAFTAIAHNIIKKEGIVYGVGFDENFRIVHMNAKSQKETEAFRGSKYVQSELGDTFSQIKMQLESGMRVLFSGTSCQVAGLNNFLGKEYENLLTVEVICHGTPSPLLWDEYLQIQRKKGEIKEINFRKKTYGYHSGAMQIVFENGKIYNGSARVDYMLKSFFAEISSRPSCYQCACKGNERSADFSIFDCWHAEELVGGIEDDDRGYTNVFVNTDKAVAFFDEIRDDIEFYEVDTQKAIELDGIMVQEQPHKHKNRDVFYKMVVQKSLKEAVAEYIPISNKDYLIEKSKKIIYKMGLTGFFVALKNKRR